MANQKIRTAEDYRAAIARIQAKADALTRGISRVSARTLANVALEILAQAHDYAPHEYGDLRASAFVRLYINGQLAAEGSAESGLNIALDSVPVDAVMTATIGFSSPHAFRQHEEVTWDHPSKKRQKQMGMNGPDEARFGRAKYIEIAFDEKAPQMRRILEEAIRREAMNPGG